MAAWTSCACSVVATLPVPMALGYVSYRDLLGLKINSPDWLVSHNNLRPVLNLLCNSLELSGHDINGLSSLTLLQALTTAENDTESAIKGSLGLLRDELVILLEDNPPFRMSENSPGDAAVLQLIYGELTSESAVWLVKNVLGSDFDSLAEMLAGEEEVEGGWRDDDLFLCCQRLFLDQRCDAGVNLPTLESSLALLRLVTISLMDLILPFL